jgi:hypothetical protein
LAGGQDEQPWLDHDWRLGRRRRAEHGDAKGGGERPVSG